MTLNQAIDMANKDFLSNGINSIRYKNGNLVNIASYSEMALRTAEKRATAYGEGEKRQEWDISTVIVYGHNGACPLCSKWQNRVYIDDVWSNGKPNGRYPLLSEAVRGGLYHSNCKDPTPQTYIEGITEPPTPNTKEEIQKNVENYNLEQVQRYNERQIRKYKRLEANSLDENNRKKYAVKVQEWQSKQRDLINAHPEQLRRDYSREKVRVLNITEPPKNATKITPIVQKDLTSDNGSGNINIGNTAGKTAVKNADDIDKNLLKYDFKPIGKAHSIEDDMKSVNPNYFTGKPEFTQNCQRYVCAYEVRRRGFNVEALPRILNKKDELAIMNNKDGWNSVFDDYTIPCIGGDELKIINNIKSNMQDWGDSSRAIVRIVYEGSNQGHVFIAEQVGEKTVFLDPQTGQFVYDDAFFGIELDKTCILRIDDKPITGLIKKCCKNREE